MDTIFIEQLAVQAIIGIHEHERIQRQPLLIDLDMGFDIREAAADDAMSATLDYYAVAQRVTAFVETARFELVETLSEEIARLLLTEFDLERVSVRIDKPAALPNAVATGVRITRTRHR